MMYRYGRRLVCLVDHTCLLYFCWIVECLIYLWLIAKRWTDFSRLILVRKVQYRYGTGQLGQSINVFAGSFVVQQAQVQAQARSGIS